MTPRADKKMSKFLKSLKKKHGKIVIFFAFLARGCSSVAGHGSGEGWGSLGDDWGHHWGRGALARWGGVGQ